MDFTGCTFKSERVDFTSTVFHGIVSLRASRFEGSRHDFRETSFFGIQTDFSDCNIGGDIFFIGIRLRGDLIFDKAVISRANTAFHFMSPRFLSSDKKLVRIVFRMVQFNPYVTFFVNIREPSVSDTGGSDTICALLFRYCILKDVYFASCDMRLFSFITSSFFEDAHFVSSNWITRQEKFCGLFSYSRHYQILEELIYEGVMKNRIPKQVDPHKLNEFWLDFELDYSNISEIYLRLKATADRAKNYQTASGFYFNEFEMKRRSHLSGRKRGRIDKITSYARAALYGLYKVIGGYGEYPSWSMLFAFLAWITFSALHLLNGFVTPKAITINYDIGAEWPGFMPWLSDFWQALIFTITRIIPGWLLPIANKGYTQMDSGPSDIVLSLLSSLTLIIIIIICGVGLKRHFRRF